MVTVENKMSILSLERKTRISNKSEYFSHKSRGSLRRCYVEKGVLKNFANFIGKQLCWGLFLRTASEICKIYKNN